MESDLYWYVYTLRYPDNTVFYVGKGRGIRIDMHERQALTLEEISLKSAKIIDLYLAGQSVVKVIEAWFRVKQHQSVYEGMLIDAYGLENLTNRIRGHKGRVLEVNGDKLSLQSTDKYMYRLNSRVLNDAVNDTKSHMPLNKRKTTTFYRITGISSVHDEELYTGSFIDQLLDRMNNIRLQYDLPMYRRYSDVGFESI